jgi:hypothetical protein
MGHSGVFFVKEIHFPRRDGLRRQMWLFVSAD